MPDANIYCLCQYKEDISEYNNLSQAKVDLPLRNIFYAKSKYTNLGPSVANQYNNLFFTEGYNQIFEFLQKEEDNKDEPILLLAEDHFFTKGTTLHELEGADCDLAYASWGSGANGSILYVRPDKVRHLFPMPERHDSIEHTLKRDIIDKIPKDRLHQLTTRHETDYRGDGTYSNNYEEIKAELVLAGIIKE